LKSARLALINSTRPSTRPSEYVCVTILSNNRLIDDSCGLPHCSFIVPWSQRCQRCEWRSVVSATMRHGGLPHGFRVCPAASWSRSTRWNQLLSRRRTRSVSYLPRTALMFNCVSAFSASLQFTGFNECKSSAKVFDLLLEEINNFPCVPASLAQSQTLDLPSRGETTAVVLHL
jgi:hypothetical protein